jgi:hypothetical protein
MDQARERESDTPRQARRLTVRATAPNLNERAQFQPIDIDRLTLERLREKNETTCQYDVSTGSIADDDHVLEHINPLPDA